MSLSLGVPIFAKWSAILYHFMPVCALIFWVVILSMDHMIR